MTCGKQGKCGSGLSKFAPWCKGASCEQGDADSYQKRLCTACGAGPAWGEWMMPSIMFGLLTVALGLWGLSAWWWSVVELLRGILPLALLFVGMLALASGVSDLRKVRKSANDKTLANEE